MLLGFYLEKLVCINNNEKDSCCGFILKIETGIVTHLFFYYILKTKIQNEKKNTEKIMRMKILSLDFDTEFVAAQIRI